MSSFYKRQSCRDISVDDLLKAVVNHGEKVRYYLRIGS